ncbi:MAG: hypothetical protein IMY84_02065 [Chloroflexi bacterium]|nr:hypothetical protein [Chloroflexota bacterium]
MSAADLPAVSAFTAKPTFFTLPPAGFFLQLFFKPGAPWSYVLLALSVLFFFLTARVVLKK